MEVKIETTYLYRQDASGKLQVWSIYHEDDAIFISWGDDGGLQQVQEELIEDGLAGRSLNEQLISRVNSRINKKLDQGYVTDRLHAINNKPVNKLGFLKPMLAYPFNRVCKIDYKSSMMQCKYDGHRCLIHYDGTEYTAYSRNGKIIATIPEIMYEIKLSGLNPGDTLDGELYIHGYSLQKITSLVKRRQPMTKQLLYIVYDVITEEKLYYTARLAIIAGLCLRHPVYYAPTDLNFDESDISRMLSRSIEDGYEGLILRRDGFAYEDGKRSKGLVKIKRFEDDEFKVVEIIPSKEGYGILVCVMKSGIQFRVTAPGDFEEKLYALDEKAQFIGKFVNVKYANLTDTGKPFHPIATMWRNKDEE